MLNLYVTLVHLNFNKSKYLSNILNFDELPFDKIVVDIITNMVNNEDISHVKRYLPINSEKLIINILNNDYEKLPSPWLMAWIHKKLMWEKFNNSNFTHFMNIEDDLKITYENINYWMKARELLRSFGLYPSFFRTEWNQNNQEWMSVDAIRGDVFDVNKLPIVKIDESFGFINIPRTYQGMFLYDRELMSEYINSGNYFIDNAFPNWRYAIQNPTSPFGLGEASHEGISMISVPNGCFSRNFLPIDLNNLTLISDALVHHVENKYTNLDNSDHGKVPILKLFTK